jgi:hypothetical protein
VKTNAYARLLRWYPASWRARYGDEMVSLLEDTYPTASAVPLGARVGLARAGCAERLHACGLLGAGRSGEDRLRAASSLVLMGWALFLVAIAIFGKVTDNWFNDSPSGGRWVASSGFDVVTLAAAAGCAVVLVAALMALPRFVGLLRGGGWCLVRAPVIVTLVSGAVAAGLLIGAVIWAHHLSLHDRDGGLPLYGFFFLTVSVAVVIALGCATWAAITVAHRLLLSSKQLRVTGLLALVLSGVMLVTLVGLVAWWASEAVHAPRYLLQAIGNGVPFTSATVPPTLLAAGVLMTIGLVLAGWGAVRIAGTLAGDRETA